jgi:hypothetical protein
MPRVDPVPLEPELVEPLEELFRLNVAVTVVGAVMLKLQGLLEPHPPPLKLVNVDPLLGTAITVTVVPGLYCMQLAPQAVPTGVMATLPLPFPLLEAVRFTGPLVAEESPR